MTVDDLFSLPVYIRHQPSIFLCSRTEKLDNIPAPADPFNNPLIIHPTLHDTFNVFNNNPSDTRSLPLSSQSEGLIGGVCVIGIPCEDSHCRTWA